MLSFLFWHALVQIFFDFQIFFSFSLIFNKHEWIFVTLETMEFMRLIHAKSIGLWWGPYIWVFSSNCQLLYLMNIVRSLSCSLICIWLFYIWTNLVSMIAHYYLLLRYDFIPTLIIFMHDSFYYLIISLVSIDFFINCHTCFTLFSINPFLGT